MQYRFADIYTRMVGSVRWCARLRGCALSGFNLEFNRGRAKVSSNETPLSDPRSAWITKDVEWFANLKLALKLRCLSFEITKYKELVKMIYAHRRPTSRSTRTKCFNSGKKNMRGCLLQEICDIYSDRIFCRHIRF